jgi:hypothetical protein
VAVKNKVTAKSKVVEKSLNESEDNEGAHEGDEEKIAQNCPVEPIPTEDIKEAAEPVATQVDKNISEEPENKKETTEAIATETTESTVLKSDVSSEKSVTEVTEKQHKEEKEERKDSSEEIKE